MGNSENTGVDELIARVAGGPSSSLNPSQPGPVDTSGAAARELPSSSAHAPAPGHLPSPVQLPLPSPGMPSPAHLPLPSPGRLPPPAAMPIAALFAPPRGELPTSYPVVPRALLGAVAPAATPIPPAVSPLAVGSAVSPLVPAHEAMTVVGVAPSAPVVAPGALDPYAAVAALPVWIAPSDGQVWQTPAAPAPRVAPVPRHMATLQLQRPSDLRVVVGKLILPVTLLIATGVAIGGYVALRGPGSAVEPSSPTTRVVERAPAAAIDASAAPVSPSSAPAPPAPVASAPAALVDVRIDSTPSGASVTLIDRGKGRFVGNTPLNVAVDPSRAYDVMFSHPGVPSHVEHLDARATRRLVVTLGKRAPAAPR
jgi:hypothetical protein